MKLVREFEQTGSLCNEKTTILLWKDFKRLHRFHFYPYFVFAAIFVLLQTGGEAVTDETYSYMKLDFALYIIPRYFFVFYMLFFETFLEWLVKRSMEWLPFLVEVH